MRNLSSGKPRGISFALSIHSAWRSLAHHGLLSRVANANMHIGEHTLHTHSNTGQRTRINTL
jgi:hypothetical protein